MEGLIFLDSWGLILIAIASLFICFFGYKMQKMCVCIMMATVFFFLGEVIAAFTSLPWWIAIILAVIGGLLGYLLYATAILVVVAVIGYCVTYALLMINGSINILIVQIISIVVGLLLGFLAYKLLKPIAIITTATAGGLAAANAIGAMFGAGAEESVFSPSYIRALSGWPTVVAIVLIVAGIIFQFMHNKHVETPHRTEHGTKSNLKT